MSKQGSTSRRVSVAPNKKQKQKRDGNSPDKEEDANSTAETQRRNVIFNEEIARLQVKEEDLTNLSKRDAAAAAAAAAEAYQKVAVRREIPEAERRPLLKRIGLLRRAPPDAPLKASDAAAHMGPRFDDHGRLIPHSILGSPEEFYRLAVLKGQLSQEDVPEAFKTPRPVGTSGGAGGDTGRLSVKYAKKPPTGGFPFPAEDLGAEESAALRNWERQMTERKRQQGYISKLLHRPPSELVMNMGEEERTLHEEKHLIDRAIPFYDYGKGYRVGSEFWNQAGRIGDEESGIHATLTQTQKGYPPPTEHVGHSRLARTERGLDWVPASTARGRGSSAGRRYPWKGPFYQRRTTELRQVMDELDPHLPDFDQLEVVGRSAAGAAGHATVRSRPTTAVTPSVTTKRSRASTSLSSAAGGNRRGPDDNDRQAAADGSLVAGPSLLFGGQPARWLGDPTSYQDTVGIEARVILETPAGRPTSQCLNIENDGSTVLFYRWKKLPKANPFGLVQDNPRRFYFDTGSGALLPGESLHFPFIFKSDKPGLFAEQWQLETTPVVCGGARLVVTLRGIAVQEDATAVQRTELEARLRRQTAAKIVGALLDEILDGIQAPERPTTPIDAYITEQEVFLRRNPKLSCTLDTLNQLRRLHKDTEAAAAASASGTAAEPSTEWDLSVSTLREKILSLEEDRQARREDLSGRLFAAVNRVSFSVDLPRSELRASQNLMCYGIVMETMDKIYNDWYHQRVIRKLPEMEMDFPDPSSSAREGKGATKRAKAADKQKSTVSKESTKASGLKNEQTRGSMSLSKERTKSPRRMASGGGRKASEDAGRPGGDLPAAAAAGAVVADQSAIDEESEEPEMQLTPELLAERRCLDSIYANTYCLLGRMAESIADVCESLRYDC
ncbi:hypothetical protein BOX15_Mlig018332g1 [Macrostomum lignano]|uniref:MYCBP-associated protein n=1 Tax=Macrostomum lignano TaxID=282301 RepID=A0A267FBK1_9PLAT|nr:hypothetical protein BOX15_Mlig018332g1 [Macrostomum lignano]